MNEFTKVAGDKINTQKLIFFYEVAMNNPKVKLRKLFYL